MPLAWITITFTEDPKKILFYSLFLILYIFSINVCSKYNHFCVQILDICGYKRGLLSKNILGYPLSCWKMRPLPDFWGSGPLWWQSWQLCPNTVSSGCRWLLTFRSSVPGWNQPCLRCSLARCWLYYCMRQTQRIIGGNFWSNSSLLANKLWKKISNWTWKQIIFPARNLWARGTSMPRAIQS